MSKVGMKLFNDEEKYYSFKPTKDQYKVLSWLKGTLPNENWRDHMKAIVCFPGEEGLLAATNGYMAFFAKTGNSCPFAEAGSYEPISISSKFCSFSFDPDLGQISEAMLNLFNVEEPKQLFESSKGDQSAYFDVNGKLLAQAISKFSHVKVLALNPILYIKYPCDYVDSNINLCSVLMMMHSGDYNGGGYTADAKNKIEEFAQDLGIESIKKGLKEFRRAQ